MSEKLKAAMASKTVTAAEPDRSVVQELPDSCGWWVSIAMGGGFSVHQIVAQDLRMIEQTDTWHRNYRWHKLPEELQ